MTNTPTHFATTRLAASLKVTYSSLQDSMEREPVATRILHGSPDEFDTYVRLLKQSYHYVCKTSPWLARASQLSSDPRVSRLLSQKAQEEKGHEDWILSDLQALGCDVSEPGRWPIASAVAAYIAWHDFAVEEQAEAILGAAYVLERLSEYAGVVAARIGTAGVHSGAASFLRGHAEVDASHVHELEQILDVIDDDRAIVHVRLSAQVTAAAYLGLLRSVAVG